MFWKTLLVLVTVLDLLVPVVECGKGITFTSF